MKNKDKLPAAFVFSGGGALGAAHVGAMRALEESYVPEFLVGTSAGAIMAAAIASGLSTEKVSTILRDKSLLKLAFDFSLGGSGLIRGRKILELLRKIYQDMNFKDLPKGITLAVCATNFKTGDLVYLNSGSIAEAVRASLSVPGLFEPMWIDNQPYVDGGLVSNFPVSYAIDNYKGNKIIGIDVCTSFSREFPPIGKKRATLRQTIERTIRVMFLQQQQHVPIDKRLEIIRPDLEKFTGIDILSLPEIEEAGFLAAKEC